MIGWALMAGFMFGIGLIGTIMLVTGAWFARLLIRAAFGLRPNYDSLKDETDR